jgi:type II secretory pathway component PulC
MRMLVPFLGALALTLDACGGASPAPVSSAVAASASAKPPALSPASAPSHTIGRSVVHAVVAQGLGAFLQHVELDNKPVRVEGRFHGFRIAALHDAPFWNGVDLKPGDVVTRVNGFPIERPEQAQKAFESLEAASELRVSYDRDGEPHELVYAIIDER